jgi:hypothetical protein
LAGLPSKSEGLKNPSVVALRVETTGAEAAGTTTTIALVGVAVAAIVDYPPTTIACHCWIFVTEAV